jgi:outer membrane protein TolC
MKINIIIYILLFSSIYVTGQKVLTLEQCRRLAVENNKELKIASAKIQIAEQERKAVRTKFFPQLSAMGTYIRNQKDLELIDYNELSLSSSLSPALAPLLQTMPELAQALQTTEMNIKKITHLDFRNVWMGDISFVQPIFMGGKIIACNQIANYAGELAKSMNNMQLSEIIYRTDEVYWQIVLLENKKKLADKYVEMLKKTDNDITAMINEGMATKVDGLSVKVKLNEAEMAQTKVNNGLALSHMLLAQICGLELTSPIKPADEDAEQLSFNEPTAFPDINTAFSNRQELRSLELATKIYKKKENIVMAEMLPNVALTANYIVTNPNAFYGYKNEFAGAYNFGVAIKIPLSGWWEGAYKKNSARAETLIKTLEFEEAQEKIELQVNQSAYKVNEAGKQLNVSKRNMEKAEENLRFADLGFKEGLIPALNLMEAQTAWFAARSQLIDAQIELKLAKVYLYKALGRFGIDE